MESMKYIVLQEMNEERFNKKHIDAKIKSAIETNPDMMAKIEHGVALLSDYISGDYYASKMARVKQLKELELTPLVMDVMVGIAYLQRPELYTSAVAQIAARLKFSDKFAAITTMGEIIAVLCNTDAFDIYKEEERSLMLVSNIPLSDNLVEFIENTTVLPPMVCTPLELTHNYSSGYLTHNSSLILGSGNHHDGDICLDVLNTMGKVRLRLDTEFLSKVEEEPKEAPQTPKQIEAWDTFKKQSYMMYSLMAQQGNCFSFNHQVDTRGRVYPQGYHINPQGSSFKKAMLEFSNEELVTGVPNEEILWMGMAAD
jgi:hypothetical protein